MTAAQGDAELLGLSLLGLAERLGRGEVTSLAATEACLRRIRASDGGLGAFLCVDEPGALGAARASDARRASGRPLGPLDGVPLALKDNLVTEGLVTTAGSRMLAGWVPPYDSAVAERLRAAGLPIVGKTNLDEFGMGSSTEASAFQVTRNPWDSARTPGGSSGGSAAAVAARQVYGALGTDTGGSIRQPAALCGVVGLKPTYGRVSRWGVVAYASSLDQVGPMGRTVRDAAALLQLIAGFDARDSTSAPEPVADYLAACGAGVRGLRVGLPKEYFVAGMDAEVERAVRGAAVSLERAGATVEEVSLPLTSVALPAYYVIATSEASANLARYDGVRYGHRAAGIASLRELYERSRAEGFGPEVKRRILLGTFALSAGYHDAYAIKAQRVRTLVRRDFEAAFQRVDVLLSAPCPVPAWPLGAMLEDPLAMYLLDALTIPCNLAGLPGVSVPVGLTAAGLPLAAQLVGRPFEEPRLLAAAQALEDAAAFTAAPP